MGKWRWLAAVAVALPQTTLAATGGGPLLHLHDQGADFSITGGAATESGPGVKGEADLNLGLADVTANIKGTVNTGSLETMGDGGAAWSGGTMSVDTRWSHGGTALNLKASRTFQHSIHDGTAAGTLIFSHAEQQMEDETAHTSAQFQPLNAVTLEFGADTQNTLTEQNQWLANRTRTFSSVETETGREYAQVAWSPVPAVTLKTGAAAVFTVMTLRGGVIAQTSYRTVEPRLTTTLKPWEGGEVSLDVEKTITPLDAANLAAYAAVSNRPAETALRPDSARAFQTSLKQKFGPLLSLDTTYRSALIDSTTVLMPA